jgi:hypothetical protein
MLRLLDTLTSEAVWAAPLFFISLIIAFLLVSRGFSGAWLTEALRSLASIFYAPWRYLRRTVQAVSLGENDLRLGTSDQYLLARFLTIIRVGFVLVFLIGAAAVVILTIEAFLPPIELRQELHTGQKNLEDAKKQLADATVNLTRENRDWSEKRDSLIPGAQAQYKNSVKETSSALEADQRAIEQDSTAVTVFPSLEVYLGSRTSSSTAGTEAKEQIGRITSQGPQQLTLFNKYCDDWDKLQDLRHHLPRSEEEIRAQAQPEHEKNIMITRTSTDEVEELVKSVAGTQKQIDEAYSPSRAFLAFFAGLATLLGYIWCYGVAIELFSMALYLLADVKRIRENSEVST